MKKVITILVTVLCVIIFSPHVSSAQTKESVLAFKPTAPSDFFSFLNDKKYFVDLRINDINIKAMRNFVKTFVNAEDEKWYKISDGYVVSFTEDSVERKAVYTFKGVWRSTISTFKESQIPADLKEQIKSAYPDFNILISYEIKSEPDSGYIIKIENKNRIKVLQIMNGEIQETGNYIKG